MVRDYHEINNLLISILYLFALLVPFSYSILEIAPIISHYSMVGVFAP
jgi:hypothetical protein